MTSFALFDLCGETLPELIEAIDTAKSDDKKLNIQISCYGGDVTIGWAAHNLIAQAVADGVEVAADVIGICASAATYPLLAAPTRRMSGVAMIMIHEAEIYAGGRAEDVQMAADQVSRYNDLMVELYSKATSLSADEARAAMKATTIEP